MSSTIVAHDLGPVAVGIGTLTDRVRDSIPKRGPAAAGIELGVGFVEGSVAGSAVVDAGVGVVLVVFVVVGALGAFLAEDAEFGWGC